MHPEGSDPRATRLSRLAWAGVLVACVVSAVLMVRLGGRPVFPLDDPYITVHNIRALHDGSDANFPGVSPLYGATSAVHLVLGSVLAFAMTARWALYVLAWFAAGLYAAGLLGLARALRLASVPTAALFVLGALAAHTTEALFNGLETGLGMAAALWAIVFALRYDTRARRIAPVLGGIAPFIRPELIALVALLAMLRWRALHRADRLKAPMRIAIDAAILVVAAAPWMLWYLVAIGRPFPTTASVKAVWFAESCRPLVRHVALFRMSFGDFVAASGPIALGLVPLALSPVGRACLAFVGVFLATYFVQLPGGLAHNAFRYAHVLIPVFVAGLALALDPRGPLRMRRAGAGLLALSVLFTLATYPARIARFTGDRYRAREYNSTARYLMESLPRDARVLAHDVGYLSAATPFRIIDVVGLKSPEVAAMHRNVTLASCGSGRGDVIDAIARREHATHLVSLRAWDERYGITAALGAHGWSLRVLRARHRGYDVYALTPPP